MAWVKLDDGFFRHPKVIRAGRDARDLNMAAWCYSSSTLTDGLIETAVLPQLAADAGVRNPKRLANRLVDVGLWEVAPGGYVIHDYLQYNPSREQVLKQRAETAARVGGWRNKARGNARSNAVTSPVLPAQNERTNSPGNAVSTPSPVPRPVPQASTPPEHQPGETDREPKGSVLRAELAPVPKEPAVFQAKHQAIYRALTERLGQPANDGERAKYGRAAKLLAQAGATSDEVFDLADAIEQRWPEAECTPMAIANNVTVLRAPARTKSTNGLGSRLAVTDRAVARLEAEGR